MITLSVLFLIATAGILEAAWQTRHSTKQAVEDIAFLEDAWEWDALLAVLR